MATSNTATESSNPIGFSVDIIKSFRPSKTLNFHKPNSQITSIDFDDTGAYCISSAEDETMQLYDCHSGKHNKSILSKKYGASLVRFTHLATNCIYASTKEDDTIRYLSLHDNKYIRYFRGHKASVDSLEVSPLNDLFLSASRDNSVRLWDLRSSSCQGVLRSIAPNFISFDPTAVIFAVGSQDISEIALYDVKNFDKQPFSTFKVPKSPTGSPLIWDKIEFSNTGKLILVGTQTGSHYLLDSFSGDLKATLHVKKVYNESQTRKRTTGHIAFTGDGRFVVAGSLDKKLYVWDTNQIDPNKDVNDLYPIHTQDANCETALVSFNPKLMLMATGDSTISFWLPELN